MQKHQAPKSKHQRSSKIQIPNTAALGSVCQPNASSSVSDSVFEKWFAGSTGDPPVPSGDSPDGTGATVRANGDRLFATFLAAVPVGGSPTGAGGSQRVARATHF